MERRPVEVRTPHVDHAGQPGLRRPAAGIAGHGDGAGGGAVVAAVGGQHLVATGGQARHPDGVLGRLGPAVGEEHHVEVARGELGDEPGGLAALVVGMERGDGAQPLGLGLDGLDHLGVLVAEVGVHQLRREVEVAVAVLVPEPRTLGAGHDERVERALGRPGVEDVGPIVPVGLALAGLQRRHGKHLSRRCEPIRSPGSLHRAPIVTAQSDERATARSRTGRDDPGEPFEGLVHVGTMARRVLQQLQEVAGTGPCGSRTPRSPWCRPGPAPAGSARCGARSAATRSRCPPRTPRRCWRSSTARRSSCSCRTSHRATRRSGASGRADFTEPEPSISGCRDGSASTSKMAWGAAGMKRSTATTRSVMRSSQLALVRPGTSSR